jgi:hypothetical protein
MSRGGAAAAQTDTVESHSAYAIEDHLPNLAV